MVLSEGAISVVRTDPDRAEDAMVRVRDTGRSGLADMRRMLGLLREDPDQTRGPPPHRAELAQLVELSRATGLPVRLQLTGSRNWTRVGPWPSIDWFRSS
ncbi:histidine kinase [Naumannella sp. ID2617S]|nr:histidine kinase [Naumannella sp. ID2617S]